MRSASCYGRAVRAVLADTLGTHAVARACRTVDRTRRHSSPAAPAPLDRQHVRSSADLRPSLARTVPGSNKVPLNSFAKYPAAGGGRRKLIDEHSGRRVL